MAVPKHRNTKSRQGRRRQHLFIKEKAFSLCPKCKSAVLPHTVCKHCGFYKGREIVDVMKKLEKKEKKQREKEIKDVEKQDQKEKKEKPMSLEELSKQKF